MSDWRVNFPVVPYKTDISGNVIETDIVETLTIMNGYVKLSQVPVYSQEPGRQVVIDGYHEVYNDPKNPADFRVNYMTGRVYFHDSQEGGMATCRYKGLGSLVAIDEINWLWEQTKKNTSFVGLIDTPDYLMPRSYFRVDSVGKTIEMVSPTVGRSYSEIYMFPVGTERPMKLHGSAYDVIHVYKPIESELENVQHLLVFDSADVAAKDGKYTVANPTENKEVTVHSAEYDTAGLVALNKITLGGEDIPSDTALRVMLDFDGEIYIVQNGLLQYIGSSAATIATQGNLPSELANLTAEALAKVRGKRLSFWLYFKCGPKVTVPGVNGAPDTEVVYSPSVDSSAVLTAELGGGLQEIPFLGKFDYVTESWTLDTSPYDGACVVTVGTGRDDVVVTADRLDFPKVAAGESVQIYAPTRTSIQVLKGEEVEFEQFAYPAMGASGYTHAKAYDGATGFIPDTLFCEVFPDGKEINKWPRTSELIAWYNFMGGSLDNMAPGKLPGDDVLRLTGTWQYDIGCFGPALRLSAGATAKFHSKTLRQYGKTSPANNGYYTSSCPYTIGMHIRNAVSVGNTQKQVAFTDTGGYNVTYYLNDTTLYMLTRSEGVSQGFSVPLKGPTKWAHICLTNFRCERASNTYGKYINCNVNGYATRIQFYTGNNCDASYPPTGVNVPANMRDVLIDTIYAYTGSISNDDMAQISEIIAERARKYANNEYVFFVANKPIPKSVNGKAYNAMQLPQSWLKNKDNERYLFKKNDRYYTLDSVTLQVQEVSIYQLQTLLWERCATIDMLDNADSDTMRQLFEDTQLVVMTPRIGDYGSMAGCSDFYWLVGEGIANLWQLAQLNTDIEIKYINDSWYVKNVSAGDAELRVLIMGGTKLIGGGGGAQLFTELADTPDSLMDTAPQALVSLNGEVVKRMYLHPYLRGEA